MVTSSEVAGQLHAAHVHGLSELNHDTIASATKDSLHGVKDGFHSTFHFPVVTFAMSSFRELNLLFSDKTTVDRALKNVAVDVSSVGAGAFIGAKAGALALCWALPPFGAVVGGLIGSIGGAIAGRTVANSIRFSEFNKARAEYVTAVENAQAGLKQQMDGSNVEISRLQVTYKERYERERDKIVADANRDIQLLRAGAAKDLASFVIRFPYHLDTLGAQLQAARSDILKYLPGTPFGFVFPREADLFRAV